MSDWILGLKKAASTWMPGVGEEDIRRAEAQAGQPFPEELRALYRQLDGGTFSTEVALFPLRGRAGGRGVLERSSEPVAGLPARGVWRFGASGAGGHLFAARKDALAQVEGMRLPDWLGELSNEGWVFGLRSGDTGQLNLYRALNELLWKLIPPAETEEFGETTFIKALNAVGVTLEALGQQQAGESPGAQPSEASAPRAPRRRPKPAAKKAVKKATRKAAKPAPKKAKGLRKAKKPAARKPPKPPGRAARKGAGGPRPSRKPSRR